MAGDRAALLQILLVVFLGTPEGLRRHHLGDDRLLERFLLSQAGNCRFRRCLLLRRMKKYHAAILCSPVRTLAVELGGVVQFKKQIQQALVAYLRRIELHVHHFCVPGAVGAHILVGWIVELAALVADGGLGHSGLLLKANLDPPKASCAKCCCLHKSSVYLLDGDERVLIRLRTGRGRAAGPDLGRRAGFCSPDFSDDADFRRDARLSWVTSSSLNSRVSPGGTSSTSGPKPTRLTFSTKCPTSSNILRISRFLPSVNTTSYQGLSASRTRLIFAGWVITRPSRSPRRPRSIITPRRSCSSSPSVGLPLTFTR